MYYTQLQQIKMKRSVDGAIVNLNLRKLSLQWIKFKLYVSLLFNINKNICLGPLVGLIFEPAKSVCVFLHTRVILVYDLSNYTSSSALKSYTNSATNEFDESKVRLEVWYTWIMRIFIWFDSHYKVYYVL